MLESKFKIAFKQRLIARLPHTYLSFIENTRPNKRSEPDLFILGRGVWAALEFKKSKNASKQPNQEYHISRLNEIGYASFVYPENQEEVLDDLEKLFTT